MSNHRGRGHCAVYYTGLQSFIITFSYSLCSTTFGDFFEISKINKNRIEKYIGNDQYKRERIDNNEKKRKNYRKKKLQKKRELKFLCFYSSQEKLF